MKTPVFPLTPPSALTRIVALTTLAFWLLPTTPPQAIAETITTETTVTTVTPSITSAPMTSAEITAQELVLKGKILELEKARLEQTKTESLEIRKNALMVEIKTLELVKARRDLLVQETKEQLAMMLQGDVLFDVNSTVIKEGAADSLRQVALLLTEYPKGRVTVTGFADSTGKPQDNLELSRKRGESVKTYLLDHSDGLISSERVTARGMGETLPVAANSTAGGRQLNRRVEITVSKNLMD